MSPEDRAEIARLITDGLREHLPREPHPCTFDPETAQVLRQIAQDYRTMRTTIVTSLFKVAFAGVVGAFVLGVVSWIKAKSIIP